MPTEVRVLLDVPFHTVPTRQGQRTLVLDLWLPVHHTGQGSRPNPLIVYIHGGGWSAGTQYRPPFQPRFYDQGIAIAAITYRFSGEAPFPACLHDCKSAVYHEQFICAGVDTELLLLPGVGHELNHPEVPFAVDTFINRVLRA